MELEKVGHSGHYKVVCKRCDKVISQCRCFNPKKKVVKEICFNCLRKKTLGANEEDDSWD